MSWPAPPPGVSTPTGPPPAPPGPQPGPPPGSLGPGHGTPPGLPRPKLDRGAGRVVLIISVAVTALLGVTLIIVGTALMTDSAGGSVLTLVLAALPVPFLVGAYLWLDRYEPEPMRFLAGALVWGAVVAVILAGGAELLFSSWLGLRRVTVAVVVAPIAEELAKGLFLVLVIVRRRHVLGGVLDGLIYAGLVGIGFAFTENVLYYAGAYSGSLHPDLQGAGATTGTFVVRGILSPFAHPLFTSAIGVGIAVAVTTRRRWLRWLAPVLGFAVAIGLHAAWNGSASLADRGELPTEFFATYVFAMLPLLGAGIGMAFWARVREGRVLSRALADAARRGWLHPAEIHWLVRLGDRAVARRFAGRVAGPEAKKAMKAYQQAATEMAFMHDRVLRRTAPDDGVDQVRAHLERMNSWRPWVVMPPIEWSQTTGAAAPTRGGERQPVP